LVVGCFPFLVVLRFLGLFVSGGGFFFGGVVFFWVSGFFFGVFLFCGFFFFWVLFCFVGFVLGILVGFLGGRDFLGLGGCFLFFLCLFGLVGRVSGFFVFWSWVFFFCVGFGSFDLFFRVGGGLGLLWSFLLLFLFSVFFSFRCWGVGCSGVGFVVGWFSGLSGSCSVGGVFFGSSVVGVFFFLFSPSFYLVVRWGGRFFFFCYSGWWSGRRGFWWVVGFPFFLSGGRFGGSVGLVSFLFFFVWFFSCFSVPGCSSGSFEGEGGGGCFVGV